MTKTITLTKKEFTDKSAEIFADLSRAEKLMMGLVFGKMSDSEMFFKAGTIVAILSDRLFNEEGE